MVRDARADLDWVPVTDWAQSWTPEFLRWRLSRPDGGYVLHVTPDAVAVSVLAHARLRVRAAVLLKVFPRPGATLPLSAAPFDDGRVPVPPRAAVRVRGLQRARPPCAGSGRRAGCSRRRSTSCSSRLDEQRAPSATFRLDTFEFLDMDAY